MSGNLVQRIDRPNQMLGLCEQLSRARPIGMTGSPEESWYPAALCVAFSQRQTDVRSLCRTDRPVGLGAGRTMCGTLESNRPIGFLGPSTEPPSLFRMISQ
jgi:hypothetical protein